MTDTGPPPYAVPTAESPALVFPPAASEAPVALREDQIQNAIAFLTHPNVRGSALASRRSFLERKGLTAAEIDESLRRVPDAPAAAAPVAQVVAGPPGASISYLNNPQQQLPASSQPLQQPAQASTAVVTVPLQAPRQAFAAPPAPLRWTQVILGLGAVTAGVVLVQSYLVPHMTATLTRWWDAARERREREERRDQEAAAVLLALQAMQAELRETNKGMAAASRAMEQQATRAPPPSSGISSAELRNELRIELRGMAQALAESNGSAEVRRELRDLRGAMQNLQRAAPPPSGPGSANGAAAAATQPWNDAAVADRSGQNGYGQGGSYGQGGGSSYSQAGGGGDGGGSKYGDNAYAAAFGGAAFGAGSFSQGGGGGGGSLRSAAASPPPAAVAATASPHHAPSVFTAPPPWGRQGGGGAGPGGPPSGLSSPSRDSGRGDPMDSGAYAPAPQPLPRANVDSFSSGLATTAAGGPPGVGNGPPNGGGNGGGGGGGGGGNELVYPPSFHEVMSMVAKGETPSNVRTDIDDQPPDPTRPPSDSRLAQRPKPWGMTDGSSAGGGSGHGSVDGGGGGSSSTLAAEAGARRPQQQQEMDSWRDGAGGGYGAQQAPAAAPTVSAWRPPPPPQASLSAPYVRSAASEAAMEAVSA